MATMSDEDRIVLNKFFQQLADVANRYIPEAKLGDFLQAVSALAINAQTGDVGVSGKLTIGAGSVPIKKVLSATANLDFPNGGANQSVDLTINVPGAQLSDIVLVGVANSAVIPGHMYFGWVSSADVVTVRQHSDGSPGNPSPGDFRVVVLQF